MRLASILPGALLKHRAALLACPKAADHVVSRPLLRFGGAFDAHRFRDLTRLTPSWTDDERCGDCRQGERFHASYHSERNFHSLHEHRFYSTSQGRFLG